ncbi:hypothetical protein QR680_002432 [Steinernema hermaphroditum]|uniref:Vacuolar fusion protein MON1 homolog n=1 Tax=Steinernema hermaphroditum TaxID=289476 RepID=A0AA39H2N7_9BILA|nr:hypothetical protein QR680_002432 [Steinernema hermaphroditum]
MSFTTGIVALLFAAYVTFELSDILLSPMEFSFAIRSQQALSKSTENSTLTDDMSNLTIQVVPSTCTESSSTDAWITLPIRMFGTVCSGKVNIEQRNAYFARCSSIRQMDENICTKEELLSAKFYITESIRNVHLKDVDESSLHEPQWEDEKCHNVIEEVYYVVSDDEVSVQFKYTTVAASNATSFSQSFSVNHMREREEMRLILTRTVAGEKSFLSVPRGGNCLNFNRSKPVAWNVSTTTACSTPVESCIDLKQKLETVIDHYRPVTLTFGEDEVRVLTKNISSAKSNGCVLPSQVNIVVGVVNIEGNRSVNFFVWETVEAQMPAKATHWWLKFHMDFVTITPKPLYENHALFPTGPSVHSVTLAAPRMHMAEVEESEGIVPGGRQTLASSESCAQLQLPHSRSTKPEDDESVVRLEDEENGDGDLEPEVSDSKILEMLTSLPYHVFVLSAYGKPIFASAGHEDRMCPLFALVQAFVHKVESWKDNLCSIDAPNLHVRFSHRHPLILCIVSRSPFQLTNQLDVVYHQILSILSKTQLKKAYELRGENYDIRKLLRGSSDRSLYGCLRSWRADPAVFMSGVRVLPMAYSDREFIASTIASTVNAANLTDGVIFGIVLAHRQLVAYVRMKRYLLAPCDLHILINTVHGNSSFRNVEVWAPICLPRFNSQ